MPFQKLWNPSVPAFAVDHRHAMMFLGEAGVERPIIRNRDINKFAASAVHWTIPVSTTVALICADAYK